MMPTSLLLARLCWLLLTMSGLRAMVVMRRRWLRSAQFDIFGQFAIAAGWLADYCRRFRLISLSEA